MQARRLGWISTLLAICLSTTHAGAANRCKLTMSPPIPVRMNATQPVITANINGIDAQFIVDTGSFFGFISPAAAAEFRLPVGNAPFGLFVTGVGGSEIPRLATVSTFTVAGATLHNMQFLVENNDLGGGAAVGVLGQNLFHIADMDFDFANGVMRFVKPEHCGGHLLAYWATTQPVSALDLHWTSQPQTQLIGKVSVNGRELDALFDTGASRTVLSLRAAKGAGITPGSPGVVAAGFTRGVGRNAVKVWVAPIDRFEIGGETIQHTHVLIGDFELPDADMLLGADFFLAHHIYVAYSQNRMFFTYNGGRVFDLNEPRSAQTGASKKAADDTSAANPPAGIGTPASATATDPGSTPPPGGPAAGALQQTTTSAAASDTPTDAAGFVRRGIAHTSRHEYLEAIADLTHACELGPTDADCRYQRGLAYWNNHQGELALADFNAAIKLQPDDFAAHLARAAFELKQKPKQQPTDAQTDLDAVDHLAPQEADLRLTLADLYRSAGNYAAAVHQYDLWTEYHQDDNRLYAALGSRCGAEAFANIDLDRALEDCNKALRAIPKSAPIIERAVTLDNRALVYLRQGQLDGALADFNSALGLLPKLSWARYGRGLAELKKGMSDEGYADLAAAEAQGPGVAKRFASFGMKP